MLTGGVTALPVFYAPLSSTGSEGENKYSSRIPGKNVSLIFIASPKENSVTPFSLFLTVLSVQESKDWMSLLLTPYLAISAERFLIGITPLSNAIA